MFVDKLPEMTDDEIRQYKENLRTWEKFHAFLETASPVQLLKIIAVELKRKSPRKGVLVRTHARYAKLRAKAERQEILNAAQLQEAKHGKKSA